MYVQTQFRAFEQKKRRVNYQFRKRVNRVFSYFFY